MKELLIGAGAAVLAGLGLGGALREPVNAATAGPRLEISQAQTRAPSAVDSWYPAEGAPPPYWAEVDWSGSDPSAQAMQREVERLLQPDPPVSQLAMAELPAPADLPREPQPYLPSQRGDILAPASYEAPPVNPPAWTAAAPEEAAATGNTAPGSNEAEPAQLDPL